MVATTIGMGVVADQQTVPCPPCPICGEPASLRYVWYGVPGVVDRTCQWDGGSTYRHPYIIKHSCASCKRVSYCGAGCQKAHWRLGHKQQCGVLKAARERVRAGACMHACPTNQTEPDPDPAHHPLIQKAATMTEAEARAVHRELEEAVRRMDLREAYGEMRRAQAQVARFQEGQRMAQRAAEVWDDRIEYDIVCWMCCSMDRCHNPCIAFPLPTHSALSARRPRARRSGRRRSRSSQGTHPSPTASCPRCPVILPSSLRFAMRRERWKRRRRRWGKRRALQLSLP